MRAVAVKVDEISGVGGLLVAGDHVDIIAVFDEGDVDVSKAVTILQNIEVLSVGQDAQEPLAGTTGGTQQGSSGQRPDDTDPQPNARTVTLAVTAEQAQLLALVQENGRIWLSLRAFGDEAPVGIPAIPLTIFGVPKN
jgi:pilus assembly protein CpaB